jgi:hypothetical protein
VIEAAVTHLESHPASRPLVACGQLETTDHGFVYGVGMAITRRHSLRVLATCLAASLALGTSACAPEPPSRSLEPSVSPSPPFADDDDALTAATRAYDKYQAMEDQISAEGGEQPDRIRSVVVREALTAAIDGFAQFQMGNLHSTGTTKTFGWSLQQYDRSPLAEEDVVIAYVCIDYSGTDLIDASGNSVVNPDGEAVQQYEVSFDLVGDGDTLILASRDVWGGSQACA